MAATPKDVRPVPHDHVLPDFIARQTDEGFRNASGLEDMQPLRRQVPNAGDEPVAEEGCDGEDMVGETTAVNVLLGDAPSSLGDQQPVQDIGGFADRGRNGLREEGTELVRAVGIGLKPWFAAGRLNSAARWRTLQMFRSGMFRLYVVRWFRPARRCP